MDLLALINPKDLIDFSQHFSITRNYLGDKLFPDQKTQNLKAEFLRLTDGLMLPTMALVHGFDTEAHIGQRPTAEKVQLEKMFIKEKINQSERVQLFLDNGGDENSIVRFVFDDVARLCESVKTRTEVMKCDVLQNGKITVKENGLTMEVDYGVPKANTGTLDFTANADVLGQLQTLIDKAADAGQHITQVVTTSKVMTALRKNTGVQKAVLGVNGEGVFLSSTQLQSLMQGQFGFTLNVYDERYRYEGSKGALVSKRYIDENKFIGISTLPNGTAGVGLWGTTPEELAAGPFTEKNASQFITAVRWAEPDPVAVWTKAAGLFIPAVPNPRGIFPQTVTLA